MKLKLNIYRIYNIILTKSTNKYKYWTLINLQKNENNFEEKMIYKKY